MIKNQAGAQSQQKAPSALKGPPARTSSDFGSPLRPSRRKVSCCQGTPALSDKSRCWAPLDQDAGREQSGQASACLRFRDSRHHDEPGRDARLQTRNPLSYSLCESSGGFVHAEKSKRERLAPNRHGPTHRLPSGRHDLRKMSPISLRSSLPTSCPWAMFSA